MRFLSVCSLVICAVPVLLNAQIGSPTCNITAVPALIRAEGVTERLGDIVLACTGTPGAEITGNLTLTINTTVTNRILSGSTLNIFLTVDSGSGETPANVPATQMANNQITFTGLRFTIGSAGRTDLRISNVRGDASFGGSPSLPQFSQNVIAQLAFNGGSLVNFTNTNFQVGVPQRGLYATTLTTVLPNHAGSPVPETPGFSELIQAGTLFTSTRVTEGYVSAFEPRQAQTDQGTRIMLRFSGYPSDARLLVPAAIAGSTADVPTAAGDFGGVVSGGRYVSGSQTLLLVRVLSTDANGAGGYLAVPSPETGSLNAMTEVSLSGGSGVAVYEVIDASSLVRESAQIPVFIGLPRSQSERNITVGVQASFAPLSSTATTSLLAPIPRFVNLNAPTDCGVFSDCSLYIPRLDAPVVNTTFTLAQGVGVQQRLIPLGNAGGGLMPWNATVEYEDGSGWVLLDRTSGLQPLLIRMTVVARADMQPGTYEATVVIDAGDAGVARYPVTLTVTAPPPPATPKPAVTAVQHGATFQTGPIARGSFATLKGSNLGGSNVSVTIDGKPASVIYSSSDQINVRVPTDITSNTAQIVVTSNGVASDAVTVPVAAVNPGIFTPGILNQDGSVNSASNPANTGTTVQIFATGLLPPDGSGMIEAKLHEEILTNLPYAGPAPGIPGLQQVNLPIHPAYPTMMTDVLLCTTAGGQRVCSPPVKIYLRNAQ